MIGSLGSFRLQDVHFSSLIMNNDGTFSFKDQIQPVTPRGDSVIIISMYYSRDETSSYELAVYYITSKSAGWTFYGCDQDSTNHIEHVIDFHDL